MIRSFGLILSITALSACQSDPMQAPGTWQPKFANDANLREMLANPSDLVAGQAATGSVGHEASVAVQRLVDDKQRPLSGLSTSTVKTESSPSTGGSGSSGAP